MRPCELMIGDWVFDVANGCYWQHNIKDYRCEERILSEFEPISLTDEILEANFEKKEHGYQVCTCWKIWRNPNYGYILATLVMDEFGGGSYEPCIPCRYVHELQHIMRMLGVDKEFLPTAQ